MSARRIRICEVGLRDGLQNEQRSLAASVRIRLAQQLLEAGHQHLEVGAFVREDRIPQMAGTADVLQGLQGLAGRFTVLVPNSVGWRAALAAGARSIAVFAAASESFSQRNTNGTIDDVVGRAREVAAHANAAGVVLRGYVSTVTHCPFEGRVNAAQVVRVAEALLDMGCEEISLGETTGRALPRDVHELLHACQAALPFNRLAFHAHDTYGMAVANVVAALERGIESFDASLGGLGGCPFAPGAAGNIATEDLLFLLHGLGCETGIDADRALRVAFAAEQELGRQLPGRVLATRRSKN
jgi:hydroxymethylglutaryl-CoA lyase